ncbi:hypothetical protein ACFFSH_12740 [Streptomyces filamentosus]|uniref:Uncharacterized protein n=1 Tax=Streptomyces filamentosus TaxID=67294 RepID=A0A919BXC3_STRFL|nr:hypothetical protein [Streptomyces filamentosus]KAA6210621.1 hypothetical protein CP979_29285 [Streptomyces filamentosus]GHG26870.1 hypothetical protein GCM10017667_74330 [Streptomyces filamentosus]
MPYETGAQVRLTEDVPITQGGGGAGFAGPLFLAEGLRGVVLGSAREEGGVLGEKLAEFDSQFRSGRFPGHVAALMDDLRRQMVMYGAHAGGGEVRTTYRVRFENGFVLAGVEEGFLSGS